MESLDKFIQDAIKTESKIDKIEVHENFLKGIISILINAGSILDQIKKNAFYGKKYNVDNLMLHIASINESLNTINVINVNEISISKNTLDINTRLFHAIVGISTESTELLEALDFSDNEMDNINIAEELGDIDWYKAIAVDELNISWEVILDTVIAKLKKRYPTKFTSEDAINRDLETERKTLEKKISN